MQFQDTLAFGQSHHRIFERLAVCSHGNWKTIVECKRYCFLTHTRLEVTCNTLFKGCRKHGHHRISTSFSFSKNETIGKCSSALGIGADLTIKFRCNIGQQASMIGIEFCPDCQHNRATGCNEQRCITHVERRIAFVATAEFRLLNTHGFGKRSNGG